MANLLQLFIISVTVTTEISSQGSDLQALLTKVSRLEDKIEALDSRLDKLETQSISGSNTKNKVKLDFEIKNITSVDDNPKSLENFTITFKADEKPLVEYDKRNDMPSEIPTEQGTFQISVPFDEVAPYIAVYPNREGSEQFYTFGLIGASGPYTSPNISNVAFITNPESSLAYSDNDPEPELVVTTKIVGNRAVEEEGLSYQIIPIGEKSAKNPINFGEYDLDPDRHHQQHRLQLVEHKKNNKEITYKLKLTGPYGERGLLSLNQRVQFSCVMSCYLYDTVITKFLPYYKSGGRYVVSEDKGFPHVEGSSAGRSLLFFGEDGSSEQTSATIECARGETCVINCLVAGDNPVASFSTISQPAIGSEPPVQDYRDFGGRAYSNDAMSFYITFASLRFESVATEAAGVYVCAANTANGLVHKSKRFTLTVA